ncbi:MAG: hypothetical protein HY301_02790 [Verrucomicrobia bacterium]|nr:hypothetical protein [Verrucomicrobiota bacterium]
MARSSAVHCWLLAVCFTATTLSARDLHVNPNTGNDRANGLSEKSQGTNGPFKTIPQAIKFARPGDTIHLLPVVYRDYAGFYGKRGEPGKPITLDGHGATLDGSEPLDPAQWHETTPGLFSCTNLLRNDDAIMGRWFFLWDGKMNHMGRTSKGPSAKLKKAEELQPGEWTFVIDPSRTNPPSRSFFGAFYVKLPPGQKLTDANIRAPMRSAGVQFSNSGTNVNAHLVIRNLTATHVYNDGFNIHGDCRDVLFENIRAIECGDDGISAHESAQYRVDGFVSIGNSTGICDTGSSETSYNRVFIRDCLGFDLYFLDTGRYAVSNSVILSSAARTFVVTGRDHTNRPCSLTLDNVFIRREGGSNELRVTKNSALTARRCSFLNLNFQATGGEVTLENCLLAGQPAPDLIVWKEVKWTGRHNVYDLRAIRHDRRDFVGARFFHGFQELTHSEELSHWLLHPPTRADTQGVGADLPALALSVAPAEERARLRQP